MISIPPETKDIFGNPAPDYAACSLNYSVVGDRGSTHSGSPNGCEDKIPELMDKYSSQGYICHLDDNSTEAALSELQGQINTFSKFGASQTVMEELQRQLDDLSQRTSNGVTIFACLCRHPRSPNIQPLRAGGVSDMEAIENAETSCEKYYQRTIGGPDHNFVITDCKKKVFNPE